jgi:hypothetical protein
LTATRVGCLNEALFSTLLALSTASESARMTWTGLSAHATKLPLAWTDAHHLLAWYHNPWRPTRAPQYAWAGAA